MIGRLVFVALILCVFAGVVTTCAQCAVALGIHGADAHAYIAWTFAERGAWWVSIVAMLLVVKLGEGSPCPRR